MSRWRQNLRLYFLLSVEDRAVRRSYLDHFKNITGRKDTKTISVVIYLFTWLEGEKRKIIFG